MDQWTDTGSVAGCCKKLSMSAFSTNALHLGARENTIFFGTYLLTASKLFSDLVIRVHWIKKEIRILKSRVNKIQIKTQFKTRVTKLYHALESERSKGLLLCGISEQRLVGVVPVVPCVQK